MLEEWEAGFGQPSRVLFPWARILTVLRGLTFASFEFLSRLLR